LEKLKNDREIWFWFGCYSRGAAMKKSGRTSSSASVGTCDL
jgi:hypothetical protein